MVDDKQQYHDNLAKVATPDSYFVSEFTSENIKAAFGETPIRDVLYVNVGCNFSFWDRIRILVGMPVRVRCQTFCENAPGKVVTETELSVGRFWQRWLKRKPRAIWETVNAIGEPMNTVEVLTDTDRKRIGFFCPASSESYAIWWTTEADCRSIGEPTRENYLGAPTFIRVCDMALPEYLIDQYQSRYGRAGRGRLWVHPTFPFEKVYRWQDGVIGDSAGGIVFRRDDIEAVRKFPGVITDMEMNRI